MPYTPVWDDKVHIFGGEMGVYAHFFASVEWASLDADVQNAFQFLVSIRVAGIQFWATQQVQLKNGPIKAALDQRVALIAGGQLPATIDGEIDDWNGVAADGTSNWAQAIALTFLVSSKADATIPIKTITGLVGRLGGPVGGILGTVIGGLFGGKARVTIGHDNVSIPIHRDGNGKITQIGATPRPH